MAFWDEVASMDNLLIGSVGGQSVTFASATGSPSFSISGIVERNEWTRTDDNDDGDHTRRLVTAQVLRSSFIVGMSRLPQEGDTMTVDGVTAKIFTTQRDLSMLTITGEITDRINRFANGGDRG